MSRTFNHNYTTKIAPKVGAILVSLQYNLSKSLDRIVRTIGHTLSFTCLIERSDS